MPAPSTGGCCALERDLVARLERAAVGGVLDLDLVAVHGIDRGHLGHRVLARELDAGDVAREVARHRLGHPQLQARALRRLQLLAVHLVHEQRVLVERVLQRQRLAVAVRAVGRHGVHAVLEVGHAHHRRQRHADDGRLAEGRPRGARAAHERLLLLVVELGQVHREALLHVPAHVHEVGGHAVLPGGKLGRGLGAHRQDGGSEHVEQLVVGRDALLIERERPLHVRDAHVVGFLAQPLGADVVVGHRVGGADGPGAPVRSRGLLGGKGRAGCEQHRARHAGHDLLSWLVHERSYSFPSATSAAAVFGATSDGVSMTTVSSAAGIASFAFTMTVWICGLTRPLSVVARSCRQ